MQLLDDYIFCYHSNFSDQKFLTKIKYCRGLKYFLTGYKLGQSEIKKFIDLCKSFENKDGFLNYDFFKIDLNKNYKILTGPFIGQIVKILNYQKNKIDLVLGNIKASINREIFYLSLSKKMMTNTIVKLLFYKVRSYAKN